MDKLWVIMPVYNEAECVGQVLDEWLPVLKKHSENFTLLAINDGSKDSTLSILQAYAAKFPEIRVLDRTNSGHGQSCIYGYRLAVQEGADWIFQIDSDGQCDSSYFEMFWSARTSCPVIYGYRMRRGDGIKRFLISRVVSLVTLVSTGVWVRDANVPYRLMSSASLRDTALLVPSDFHLANILLSALQKEKLGIKWISIGFRKRLGGVPSVKAYMFGKHGLKLMKQLRAAYNRGANSHLLVQGAPSVHLAGFQKKKHDL